MLSVQELPQSPLKQVGYYVLTVLLALFYILGFYIIFEIIVIVLASNLAPGTLDTVEPPGGYYTSDVPNLLLLGATIACIILFHLVYVRFKSRFEQEARKEFSRDHIAELGIGLLAGLLLFSLVFLVIFLLGSVEIVGTNPNPELLVTLILGLQAGYIEEIVFRGVLYRRIARLHGHGPALAITSLFFGFAHLVNPGATLMTAIGIMLTAGILLGLLYATTQRLWLVIGLHLAWNTTQAGIFGFELRGQNFGYFVSETSGSSLITGGEYGFEGSVITILIFSIISGAIIYRYFVQGSMQWGLPQQQDKGVETTEFENV